MGRSFCDDPSRDLEYFQQVCIMCKVIDINKGVRGSDTERAFSV